MEITNPGKERLRPTTEDHLRALGYGVIALWSVLFTLFPPMSAVSYIDTVTRVFWMVFVFVGSVMALIGAERRIDFKLEFPGLLLTLIGPLFYFASQLYYVVYPSITTGPPAQRYAFTVYVIIPGFLLLPRTFGLYRESRRLKKINLESIENARAFLSETGEVQSNGARREKRH